MARKKQPDAGNVEATRKHRRWPRIVGIVALVVVGVAAVAFLYLRSLFTANTPEITIGEASDQAIVSTTGGEVRGYVQDGVYTYHGIPYASVSKRFVAAGPVQTWDGVRDATDYGPISPQGSVQGMSGGSSGTTSEDPLNLNVWTPGINDGAKRPVMVWLHGGGFSTGSANDAAYDGTALASSEDVVVVGVNHRLNVFGYLDLSAYGDEYTANEGLTDIVAALQWVRDNAEAFGGDSSNVTVFGQSGGGAKVLALMAAPSAQGLFSRGIVQSGATDTMGLTFATEEQSQALTAHVLQNLGISAGNIEAIQDVSEEDLQNAADDALQTTAEEFQIPQAFGNGYAMEWGPVVDGSYLPTNPVKDDGTFADAGRDVPLLIGSNLNEWAMMGQHPTDAQATDEVRAAFVQAYPNEDSSQVTRMDTLLRYPILRIARAKVRQAGAPVYSYVFAMNDGVGGAYHGAEIPYVFHHVENDSLSDQMAAAWANFARNGVPSAEGLPTWEPYTVGEGATDGAEMILDHTSYVAYNHDLRLLRLLRPDYDLG